MSDDKQTVEASEGAAKAAPDAFVRVRITAYKVWTTQGRGIKGQFMELPGYEAELLIEDGSAIEVRDGVAIHVRA